MWNKRFLYFLTLLVSACGGNNQVSNVIHSSGELQNIYETMDELVYDSKIIVEIKVNDYETVVHGDIPFTISTADVSQSIKGNLTKGDSIKILETGGKFKPLDKQKKLSEKESEFVFDGIKVMSKGNTYIVFLDDYIGPITNDSYVIKGVYQGKFEITKDNKVIQQATEETKLKNYLEPLEIEKFVKEIKEKSK